MRLFITASNLMVSIMIIIFIHTSLIGQTIRNNEITSSLNSSMDYAYDKLMDYYEDTSFINNYTYNDTTGRWEINEDKKDEIIDALMMEFCNALKVQKMSVATMKVELKSIDLTTGVFEIKVTETYPYFFGNKTGSCTYQKRYTLV